MYLPPPDLASPSRPSYAEAYDKILAAHRRSPLTSASSVIVLVAPDVDAICAARMLADLFKQDDLMHRIVPISGLLALETFRDELMDYTDLHTLIMINMGSILDLPGDEWFGGNFPNQSLIVHVIDSSRPQNLSSLFGAGDVHDRIVVWDDGGAEKLDKVREAWEALQYQPEVDSDEDDDDLDDDHGSEDDEESEDEDAESSSPSRKRRSRDQAGRRKRRRLNEADAPRRMSRVEREENQEIISRHYFSGTWHGQSASGTAYVLATVLERVDNDMLWLGIMGLTYQYVSSRISRSEYDNFYSLFHDEVARLNPPAVPNAHPTSLLHPASHPSDRFVQSTEELRFTLFRHWTLYDAMYHSPYVASKLGIWRERGKKRLTGLLAKMGLSIQQTQQLYTHMSPPLKRTLRNQLAAIAPEYGLLELSYPSFSRGNGFGAADAVEAVAALLEAAGGVRLEVEVEGGRGGGEWFGGGRAWEGVDWNVEGRSDRKAERKVRTSEGDSEQVDDDQDVMPWWQRNFWTAYDALSHTSRLRAALPLSMSLHRAIIRTGTELIDKQSIRTLRTARVAVLHQSPDLPLFIHPGVLSHLALWLVEVFRDRVGTGSGGKGLGKVGRIKKRRSLPVVVAALDEKKNHYIVVGVTAALDFGEVEKNQFGLAFLEARDRCNAQTSYTSFDTSVLEIEASDLELFLEALAEGVEGY